MSFLKRLGYYLIGVSMGLVFLAYIFKEKNTEFCYSPNCRVLKNIRTKTLTYAPKIQQLIDNKAITTHHIDSILHDGDVIFKRSDTKSVPCKTYLIKGSINNKKIEMSVKNCETSSQVEDIIIMN